MVPIFDLWSVVLSGVWNPAVFTPTWIGNGNLTSSQNIEIGFDINDLSSALEFKFDGIRLRPSSQWVQLLPTNDTPETLRLTLSVAQTILTRFPGNPIRGTGINFGYLEREPTPIILRALDSVDKDTISDRGWLIRSRKIERQLSKDGRICNFSISNAIPEGVALIFNFHTDVMTQHAGLEALNVDINSLQSDARQFARDIYNIDP